MGLVFPIIPQSGIWIYIWQWTKKVPGLENTTLSGKFLCKMYEGDFKETGKWCEDFKSYAKAKNPEARK